MFANANSSVSVFNGSSAPVPRVGVGFREVPVGTCIEKGDQYAVVDGTFRSYPLDSVGLLVTDVCLVRRMEKTLRYSF